LKVTEPMIEDVKKYVIKGRMDSAAIFPLLVNDYPQHAINKRDLYNMVYNLRHQNNPGEMDASQMLQTLFAWKDSDPRWIVNRMIMTMK
jgi:hypothetical protein